MTHCRHCGHAPANRPRGLCWTCYSRPAIRALYCSTSIYGRWANGTLDPVAAEPAAEPRRGMTRCDRDEGQRWLIIGTRPDGEQLVIEEARTEARAQKRAARLRAQLEGYARIGVARIGEEEEGGDDASFDE